MKKRKLATAAEKKAIASESGDGALKEEEECDSLFEEHQGGLKAD